jgi:hypothetical protein
VHPEHCPDIGPVCQQRDEPPQLHDQMFYVGELRGAFELGINDNFSFELQVPLRVSATTVVYRRLDGTPFEPDYGNIHHRNETLAGFADPTASLRTIWSLGSLIVGGKAGLMLPIGKTEVNPFALGRAGLAHQHIQFGTGTVNPVLALDLAVPLRKYHLRAYGQTQLVLYENEKGFRAGHRFAAGVLGDGPIVGDLQGAIGVDVANEQPERWDGKVEQDGNLGRTDLLVGASLSYPVGKFRFTLGVKVPVYQHIIVSGEHGGGQLSYPAIVTLGVQRLFESITGPTP